jgi:hypothetical protein
MMATMAIETIGALTTSAVTAKTISVARFAANHQRGMWRSPRLVRCRSAGCSSIFVATPTGAELKRRSPATEKDGGNSKEIASREAMNDVTKFRDR